MAFILAEFGTQPGIRDLQSQHFTHHTGTHGHHVGVVMLPGQAGRHQITQQGAADALDLIGSDGNTDAGGAKDDTLLKLAGGNCLGSGAYEIRIVAGSGGVGAEIFDSVALTFQVRNQLVLQIQSTVVTGNCNFHNMKSPFGKYTIKQPNRR